MKSLTNAQRRLPQVLNQSLRFGKQLFERLLDLAELAFVPRPVPELMPVRVTVPTRTKRRGGQA